MKMTFAVLMAVFSLSMLSPDAHAQKLDKKYKDLKPTIVVPFNLPIKSALKGKSNSLGLLARQTPVKSQGSRGTCSIFSATALLESMLVIRKNFNPAKLDLSEEWLEYLIMTRSSEDGSTSSLNFSAFGRFGTVTEARWPYVGDEWTSTEDSPLAQERCGHLSAEEHGELRLTRCLLGHRDPALLRATDEELEELDADFLGIRNEAKAFQEKFLANYGNKFKVPTDAQVKYLLEKGIPLTLDLDFYYGAWNHREADALGIGRNMEHWRLGIVGHPAPGSLDESKSLDSPAGHSIVVIGYDDTIEVETTQRFYDPKTKKVVTKPVVYRGVYYFKNSWGSDSFGVDMTIDGRKAPGYGMITQAYAHEHGGFYRMPLN